ncbi:hypothetical protein ACFPH6_20245 [Streptomyces xiangluensis]|uniref:Uncharacterized protein n=1 Tax=Streptomyces xiangluensis TaxID=2665720 RepID=A0ABV8YUJ2_9ACTN
MSTRAEPGRLRAPGPGRGTREAAKKNGAARKEKPKRRTGTVVRRDGREPLGLGTAIGLMMAERGMVAPAAGGTILAEVDTRIGQTRTPRPEPPRVARTRAHGARVAGPPWWIRLRGCRGWWSLCRW